MAVEKYVWIRLRFDKLGLYTADLMFDNDCQKNIGGSYPSWTPLLIDAKQVWGSCLPVHWPSFKVKNG